MQGGQAGAAGCAHTGAWLLVIVLAQSRVADVAMYTIKRRGDKLSQLEVGDTVFDENAAMEPKKKGRFLVMEQVRQSQQPDQTGGCNAA